MTSNSQEKMFHMKRLKKITTTKNKPKIIQNQKLIRGWIQPRTSSQNTRQITKRTNGVKSVRTQQHYDLTDKRPITSRLKVLELLLSHKYHQRGWNTHVAYQGDYLTDCWNVSNSSTFTQTPCSIYLWNTVLTPGFNPSRKRLYITILTGA